MATGGRVDGRSGEYSWLGIYGVSVKRAKNVTADWASSINGIVKIVNGIEIM